MLPGWQVGAAAQFVRSRPPGGFNTLTEIALAAAGAGLTTGQVTTLAMAGGFDSIGGRARYREAVVEILPALMEWASGVRSDTQADLFSTPQADPPDESPTFEEAPPTPRTLHLRRTWEERALGAGLTASEDIDALREAMRESGGLSARLTSLDPVGVGLVGESVRVVGLLCAIRLLRPAAAGGPMAVALLESEEGSVELLAFPPGYKRHAALWTEGNMLVVTARVSAHPDGEIYLLCEHLAPFRAEEHDETLTVTVKAPRRAKTDGTLTPIPAPAPAPEPVGAAAHSAAPAIASVSVREAVAAPYNAGASAQPGYSLIISIPASADDHVVIDSMISLNNLLSGYPGHDIVTIRVPYSADSRRWTSARLPWGVAYTQQLDARIRRLLGDEALAVIRLAG
jgi:DNA polymerase III alpha subunit